MSHIQKPKNCLLFCWADRTAAI